MIETASPAHAALAALAGDWEGTEEIGASPWTTPGSARGFHTLRVVTRGVALVQDYEQRRDGSVTLTAHGVFAVDPQSSDVLWWLFDDFGYPPLSPSRGAFATDGALVLEKATERGRQRATFAPSGDLLIHRIEVAPAGHEDFTLMLEAAYERSGR